MLDELHAERQLAAIEAASAPYMTPAGQRQALDRYNTALNVRRERPARRPMTVAQLRAAGINVEIVPPEGSTDG